MELLVEKDSNVVITATNKNITQLDDRVEIRDGDKTETIFYEFNVNNSLVFSVDDALVPEGVAARYCYDGNNFTFNPVYVKIFNSQFKEIARKKINEEVGDTLDQLADTDKQLQLVTPLIIRVYKLLTYLMTQLGQETPEDIIPSETKQKYDTFSDLYLGLIAAGQYQDRIDVETDPKALIQRILFKNTKIAQLVKAEYLDKKI